MCFNVLERIDLFVNLEDDVNFRISVIEIFITFSFEME